MSDHTQALVSSASTPSNSTSQTPVSSSSSSSSSEATKPRVPIDHAARVYAALAMKLVVPVTLTLIVIVWAVQSLGPVDNRNPVRTSSVAPVSRVAPIFVVVPESPGKSTGSKIGGALLNMLIVVGVITVITFLMVCLYKYGYGKVLYVWLGLAAAMVFFFLAAIFIDLVATRYQVPYDYVMISLWTWNFGVVGISSVFYMGHPLFSQAYLVVVSVIVAWGLVQTPEWTTWALLVGVACYDILAVLCPNGPLRLLVEAAQERKEPIPGFIYDSDSGPSIDIKNKKEDEEMKNTPTSPTSSSKKKETEEEKQQQIRHSESTSVTPVQHSLSSSSTSAFSKQEEQVRKKKNPLDDDDDDVEKLISNNNISSKEPAFGTFSSMQKEQEELERKRKQQEEQEQKQKEEEEKKKKAAAAEEEEKKKKKQKKEEEEKKKKEKKKKKEEKKKKGEGGDDESDDDDGDIGEDPFAAAHNASAFKLGLGDFIFYSILVGRAAMSLEANQTPWLVCYICIIGGMGATLASLLFLRGKVPALPALPFSIFAATIAFFVTRYLTMPYWDFLILSAYVT